MSEVCEKDKCTGCGACVAVCAHEAVSISEGRLGARVSLIDPVRCVDCGLCKKVCPVVNPIELKDPDIAYAAYARAYEERSAAASGGAASMLSRVVVRSGGVVYGCALEDDMRARHLRVDSLEGLDRLRGSKYVQSDMTDVFRKVRNDLREGLEVLFIGTPCQVAGLKNFVGLTSGLDEKLMTIDLCCHGTPSQDMLKAHIDCLGLGYKAKKISFRDKSSGNIRYVFRVNDKSGTVLYENSARKDYYMSGFLSGMFLRENCFSCRYAQPQRCSDMTLADYWSMGVSADPEMIVSKGLSTVLVNTEKGHRLFESMSDVMVCEERPMNEALRNGQFRSPSEKPEGYDNFADCYEGRGYEESCRRFLPACQRKMLIQDLKTMYYKWPFRQFLRKLLKR